VEAARNMILGSGKSVKHREKNFKKIFPKWHSTVDNNHYCAIKVETVVVGRG
jgi:hypothetical protein